VSAIGQDERPTAADTKLPRTVWVLSVTSYLRDVASEMLVHLVPLFLANALATPTGIIGLIEGLAEATASVTKIYSGWLSDRLGRRKGLTALGYGLAALALVPLAVARSWPVVLGARFADRLGKGIRTAPRDALIADAVPAERRGASFGLHRAADSAGALTGLLVAAALVWRAQRGALLLDAATFRSIVAWALVPAGLAALVVVVGIREARRTRAGPPPRLTLAGLDHRFRRFLAVTVLFTLGNSTDAFLVLRAQAAGATVLEVLGMLAGFNLVYALAAGPAGALSDRWDRRRLIAGGWLLYAAVYVGFALAGATWQLWALYAAYGVYYALTEGVGKALVADLVPAERRGTAFGVYHAAIGLTALPASIVAGVLWQGAGGWPGLGPAAPFLLGGLLALAASLLLWRWVR
jgi:MFS family permease